MTTEKVLLTAEDLLRLQDDQHRYELLDGELVELSLAGGRHGKVMAKHVTKRKAWKGRRQAAHASVSVDSTRLGGPVAAEAAGTG